MSLDGPYRLQEVLRLWELLRLVAAELERLATEEPDAQRREVLLKRAMRIRARLYEVWPRARSVDGEVASSMPVGMGIDMTARLLGESRRSESRPA